MVQLWKYVKSEVCGVVILETLSARIAPIKNLKACSGRSLFSADDFVPFWSVSHNVEKPSVVCTCAHLHAFCVCVYVYEYIYMHVCTQP